MVKLSTASLKQLQRFRLFPPPVVMGKPWGQPQSTSVCELTISSVASKVAWGSCLHLRAGPCHTGGEVSAVLVDSAKCAVCGAWSKEQAEEFIHLFELWAVIHTFRALQTHLQARVVHLLRDNSVVVVAIREGFSHSAEMRAVLQSGTKVFDGW